MTTTSPSRTLRLSEVFPREMVAADGPFSHLDDCASDAPGGLVYCQNLRFLEIARGNACVGAMIVTPALAKEIEGRALAVADDPRLEFFRLYRRLALEGFLRPYVEPGRGASCDVHETAVLSAASRIGDRVTIGARALVLDGSRIEDDTFVAPGAIVGAEGMITVDAGDERLRIPHAGGVHLGRNVVVLSQAVIVRSLFRRPTTVGDQSQIGIHATIGHGAQIGKRCVVRGNTVISGRAVVEDGAVVSLASSVADARTVGAGAEVMMGSVVVSDVPPGAAVSGNFAYDHRKHVNDHLRRSR